MTIYVVFSYVWAPSGQILCVGATRAVLPIVARHRFVSLCKCMNIHITRQKIVQVPDFFWFCFFPSCWFSIILSYRKQGVGWTYKAHYSIAITMNICSEGDVITPEHAYVDILNTAVMGLPVWVRVKPVSCYSLVFPWYGNYHIVQITTPVIRARKSVDDFMLSDVNIQKSNHNAQIDVSDGLEDSIVLENSPSVDEREKIVKFSVRNEYTCLYYAMLFNSLRTEKHRMTFSKSNLGHPSKAFVDFMINDQTSPQRYKRRRYAQNRERDTQPHSEEQPGYHTYIGKWFISGSIVHSLTT